MNKRSPVRRNQDRQEITEEDGSSIGELEFDENTDGGAIDQNKIADFNAHSNSVLMQSRS